MRLGLLAILVGVIFLLKNLGFISPISWSILWPIIVIYIGISMITRDRCWHCGVWHEGKLAKKSCRDCAC